MLTFSCRLPYKGTNFSANHNANDRPHPLFWLSITLQRYKFLSKSQRVSRSDVIVASCRLPYKGTNFSANHNKVELANALLHVVDYLTKVQISQQITTHSVLLLLLMRLSITLQRYKFLSKSQLVSLPHDDNAVVDYLTKVQISQQITTHQA